MSASRPSRDSTQSTGTSVPLPEPTSIAGADPLGALTDLAGIGPARASKFEAIGVRTLRDLLFLAPRGLFEWPGVEAIATSRERRGARVRVRGVAVPPRLVRMGGKRSLVRITVEDESGSIEALFFNQPWMRDNVRGGETYELCGRVQRGKGGEVMLVTPRLGSSERPLPPAGYLAPRYQAPDGVSEEALAAFCRAAAEQHAGRLDEPLSERVLARFDLPELARAVLHAHRPPTRGAFEAARRRLAFEPLLAAQARLAIRRRSADRGRARPAEVSPELHAEILGRLPFTLTQAQARVVSELRRDLGRRVPMRRLLQGDVGAGKTVLGLYAAIATVEANGQAAFMAPTELLAEQHYYGLRDLLTDAGVEAALFTGSMPKAERRVVLERLARGDVQVLFGTHALFSGDVRFSRLDLAIIDEQHRFGVEQRARLAGKGEDVHLLLMTATPIPRTLALTLYGDLDVSMLEGLPPGRGSITTRWVRGQERRRISAFLEERMERGEQVYWVCPRIGADTAADEDKPASAKLASAERRHEQVLASKLAPFGVELVHGKLPADERSYRLDRFRRGEIAMLVATTVIEVGVDVSSATVIVIENAERLGLAQLHQLRGRVGRGPVDSHCLLLGNPSAEERFRVLERTRDGFELAEEDLRTRGMGDLMGLRQSGLNTEGFDPDADLDLLLAARDLVRDDDELARTYAGRGSEPLTP
ncbi:MAG: ATP-dependent DNA helicase RecG [bacterium]|nr:ATP-dependent DNA helicase RecG [bacterium]